MADTYFELSRQFAVILDQEGLSEEAKRLRGIIDSTFSSTELLMGTRYVLSSIDLSKISETGRKKVLVYLEKLDGLLGPKPN